MQISLLEKGFEPIHGILNSVSQVGERKFMVCNGQTG